MTNDLKPGDFLFCENHSHLARLKNGLHPVTIEKITPKGNLRLANGKLLDEHLNVKGASTWGEDTYFKPTPELVARYELEQAQRGVENQLDKLDLTQCSMEQLQQLTSILKTVPKKSV